MARTKKSTLQTKPKGKRRRKEQLKKCRANRKIEQGARKNPQTAESAQKVVVDVRTPSTSRTGDTFLGELTRTQFKTNSYAQLAAQGRNEETPACPTRGVNDFGALDSMIGKLCCPQCLQQTLKLRNDLKKPHGLAMHATVYCLTCEEDVPGTSQYLSTKDDGKKDYTVNQQAVFAALVCGMGAQQLNKFCESMDLPGVHHKTFQRKAEKLYAKMNELEDVVFSETVKYVREVHAKHNGITLSDDDVLDISVSFDGLKRQEELIRLEGGPAYVAGQF